MSLNEDFMHRMFFAPQFSHLAGCNFISRKDAKAQSLVGFQLKKRFGQ
jgi:hypothetical protein